MDGNEMRKQKLKEKMDEANKFGKRMLDKAVETVKNVAHWAVDNPKEAAFIASAFALGKKFVTKTEEKKEYDDKRKRYWDGTTMWYLKRELSTRQKLELECRRMNGEFCGDILAEMGVLKY